MFTYRDTNEADQDKAHLAKLVDALCASPSCVCLDECRLWIIRGRSGCYASTFGDGKEWLLVVTPTVELSGQAWTWAKKRLKFCKLTQDGDNEGCFRLERLPTESEAIEVRDILGIRKRTDLSPDEVARRQELARRMRERK
jgi:hypothetical protein